MFNRRAISSTEMRLLGESANPSALACALTAMASPDVVRTLMETDPRPRASRATRQALTVALVKPGRGSWPYQAKNSSSPRLYTRLVIGEETLSRTRVFNLRQSAALFANAISFIWVPLLGHIGSHTDLTSGGTETSTPKRRVRDSAPKRALHTATLALWTVEIAPRGMGVRTSSWVLQAFCFGPRSAHRRPGESAK